MVYYTEQGKSTEFGILYNSRKWEKWYIIPQVYYTGISESWYNIQIDKGRYNIQKQREREVWYIIQGRSRAEEFCYLWKMYRKIK